jgi:hypothetical protein
LARPLSHGALRLARPCPTARLNHRLDALGYPLLAIFPNASPIDLMALLDALGRSVEQTRRHLQSANAEFVAKRLREPIDDDGD